MPIYLTQSIHKGLRECPDSPVAICGSQTMTRATFADRVARLAGALRSAGLQPGDRVGVLGMNSIRLLEAFYGIWWAGGVLNPVNIRWSVAEVAFSLDDCDTRWLIVDDTFVSMVAPMRERTACLRHVLYCGHGAAPNGTISLEAALVAAQPAADALRGGDDLAAIMYTGGTTGKPKGVMLSHHNLGSNLLSNLATLPRDGLRCGLVAAPMFHVGGCALALLLMQRLVPQVILPGFDEEAVMAAIQAHRVDEVFLVPTMLRRLLDHPRFRSFDLSSLRLVLYGAAPIDAALLERAMAALPAARFAQAYGMTELAPTVSVLLPQDHLPGPQRDRLLRSAGRPAVAAEIRIVDEQGLECAPGATGEITVRGPMVMQGYWQRPQETVQALRGGWMHTGDAGFLDAEGYLYVVDRLKDMIVTGGENVYSAEVENALASLPGVSMSAVIGVPDVQWGERVHAVIVLAPGATLTAEQVIAHCRAHIAGYKCPRSVEFREVLPLTAAGKLQKFALRAAHWAGYSRLVNG